MDLELKKGAFFIADAHENEQRQGFLDFLHALFNGQIQTPQLILMGDIFEIFVGQVRPTHDFAAPYVNLLESIAARGVEVLYVEGNHDFNLAKMFRKVRVFALENQPLCLKSKANLLAKRAKFSENKVEFVGKGAEFKGVSSVMLAHGDIFLAPLLSFALKSLRNPILLKALNLADKVLFGAILAKIKANQKKKNLFYQIKNFENLAKERYAKYRVDNALVVEGHYHQNTILNTKECKYINLPTFAYERSFFVVE